MEEPQTVEKQKVTADDLIWLMEKVYGDKIADHEIYPGQFMHQLKVCNMYFENKVYTRDVVTTVPDTAAKPGEVTDEPV